MKVRLYEENMKNKFKDLIPGNCFVVDNIVYMKISPLFPDSCVHANATRIKDGTSFRFPDYINVRKVNLKAVLDE